MTVHPPRPPDILDVFLVAGEESGDRLGAALMRALRERTGGRVRFAGVGGRDMTAEGIASLYPIDDLPIIGFTAIPRRAPKILRLIRFTAARVVATRPHVLVVIDSPGFNRGIARRVRAGDPAIPIVEYVSPAVWAWRPGRARAMRTYIDHILALLPFEPDVHRRLGGPPCTYVGHPLAEEVRHLRPNPEEARRRLAAPPVLLVLPGSRAAEIRRLLDVFAATVALVSDRTGPLQVVMPTVPIGVSMHTWAVTACGGTSIGLKGAVAATEVLTRTALDVLTDEELRAAARADFERRTEGIEYVSPIPEGQAGPRGYRLPASPP